MSENEEKGPLQTLRDGPVFVKLWRQESEKGPFPTAQIGRTYVDKKTGEYKESHSLSGRDLLKLQALVPDAYKEIVLWQDYFREQTKDKQSEQTTELAEQRDRAMSQTRKPERGQRRSKGRER